MIQRTVRPNSKIDLFFEAVRLERLCYAQDSLEEGDVLVMPNV